MPKYFTPNLALINAGSPLIGFGDVPLDPPLSVIDFHGLNDGVIPYDLNHGNNNGEGPHDSVTSWDYYFYEQKPQTVSKGSMPSERLSVELGHLNKVN